MAAVGPAAARGQDGSRAGSSQLYTPQEVRALTPIRETVEKRAPLPDLRHIFLCHAWDDRQGAAKNLYDLLVALGVSVGSARPTSVSANHSCAPSIRAWQNRGSEIVLVTPSLLKRLPAAGVADKELSVLLQRDQLVPIIHNTTYDDLRQVSPMLASRNGPRHRGKCRWPTSPRNSPSWSSPSPRLRHDPDVRLRGLPSRWGTSSSRLRRRPSRR